MNFVPSVSENASTEECGYRFSMFWLRFFGRGEFLKFRLACVSGHREQIKSSDRMKHRVKFMQNMITICI